MKNFILFLGIFFSFLSAHAQKVTKVQGNKVLVQSDSDVQLAVGQEVFLLNANNKKVALAKVTIVKGNKAQVEIIKGKTQVGDSVQLKKQARAGEVSPEEQVHSTKPKWGINVILGLSMDSLNMTGQDAVGFTKKLPMAGTSFQTLGHLDYYWTDELILRGGFGLVGFNTAYKVEDTETSVCNGNSSCTIQFSYMAFEGYGVWFPYQTSSMRWGLGGGYAYFLRSSGTTNVYNFDATVSTNTAFLAMTELDFILKKNKYFIPIILEYKSFAGGSGITASSISLSAGLGYLF